MNLIFAKLILAITYGLPAGSAMDFPFLQQSISGVPNIGVQEAVETVYTAPSLCLADDPDCIPAPGGVDTRTVQWICMSAGVYVVEVRAGFVGGPTAGGHGRVYIRDVFAGSAVVLGRFRVEPGRTDYFSATVSIPVTGRTCVSLRYDLAGQALLDADQRVTGVHVYRVGQ